MNRLVKGSRDLEFLLQSTKKLLSAAMAREKDLQTSILELQRLYDKSTKAMEAMEPAFPVKAIRRERYGPRG